MRKLLFGPKIYFMLFLVLFFVQAGTSQVLFEDGFDDSDFNEWTVETNSKNTDFQNDFVRFSGSGVNGDDVILSSVVDVNSVEKSLMAGALRFESISDNYRDHEIDISFRFIDNQSQQLGFVKYYTRWEGTNDNYVSGKCTESGAGSWCTYNGIERYSPDGTSLYVDMDASNQWRSFNESWDDISNDLSSIKASEVDKVEVRVREYSAWSAGNTVSFSNISLVEETSGPLICDRIGSFNQCISETEFDIASQSFNIDSMFEVRNNAVFRALNDKAQINVSNSSRISGLWEGSFDIISEETTLVSGAKFKPKGGRIEVG